MIDLVNGSLPNTVKVGGREFLINTDFRIWMRFSIEYDNRVGEQHDWDISYLFKGEAPVLTAMPNSILLFAFNPNVCPKCNDTCNVRAFDYETDSELIYSAFMQQYHIDLMTVNMHWHIFKALLSGITEPCKLAKVIGYRLYDGKDKDLTKLRREWELPVIKTEQDLIEEERFNSFFE